MKHIKNMLRYPQLWIIAVVLLASCSKESKQATTDVYTCPMHPTAISDKPGACPVCGMDLVRKARAGEEVKITEDLAPLLQSPDEAVLAGITTIHGAYRTMDMAIEAHGVVTFDTRFVHDVPARVGGRLESVYVHYGFQPVKKGQKLFEIYSPELLTAQEELLYLLRHDAENAALVEGAKTKLTLLGVSSSQVEELVKVGAASPRFAIFSPFAGYAMPVTPSSTSSIPASSGGTGGTSSMGGSGMGGGTTPVTTASIPSRESMIHEGDYVGRGQRLLTLVSLEALRVELKIPAAVGSSIHQGDTLTVALNNGRPTKAKVDFVQPFFDQGEEFLKVRVYVRNADLQLSQLVEARISRTTPSLFWLPAEAVADLGSQKVVFVKTRGLFKPRTVVTGMRADGWIEIRQGLASTDEVASKAAFLVDSESFIKTK